MTLATEPLFVTELGSMLPATLDVVLEMGDPNESRGAFRPNGFGFGLQLPTAFGTATRP